MSTHKGCKERREARQRYAQADRDELIGVLGQVAWYVLAAIIALHLIAPLDAFYTANAAELAPTTPTAAAHEPQPAVLMVALEPDYDIVLAEFVTAYIGNRRSPPWDDGTFTISNAVLDWSELTYEPGSSVSPLLVLAVLETENDFTTRGGDAGEIGLMQIMPFWRHVDDIWQGENVNGSLRGMRENVRVGILILKRHDHGDMWAMLKSYNGSGRYADKVIRKFKEISATFYLHWFWPFVNGEGE